MLKKIEDKGGKILFHTEVTKIFHQGKNIKGVEIITNNKKEILTGEYYFSTTSIKEIVNFLDSKIPQEMYDIGNNLQYRDFLVVGLLLNKLKIQNKNESVTDNWLYIQDPHVEVGRLQIFNNWSPYMVQNPDTFWIGAEYFCNKGEDFWEESDSSIIEKACKELESIGIIETKEFIDGIVVRVEKAYPAYTGVYKDFESLKNYLNMFENLFLIGRNGMHKYNNQDHSMLTAITAVQNIINNNKDKGNIWNINTEQEYHEESS